MLLKHIMASGRMPVNNGHESRRHSLPAEGGAPDSGAAHGARPDPGATGRSMQSTPDIHRVRRTGGAECLDSESAGDFQTASHADSGTVRRLFRILEIATDAERSREWFRNHQTCSGTVLNRSTPQGRAAISSDHQVHRLNKRHQRWTSGVRHTPPEAESLSSLLDSSRSGCIVGNIPTALAAVTSTSSDAHGMGQPCQIIPPCCGNGR
jgi:hypothetical protein